jgi:hypothetical protein
MPTRGLVAVILLAASGVRTFAAAPAQVMSDAEASRQCAPADEALATLKAQYGEMPFFIGDDGDGTSVIVTRRADAGSWTLLAVGQDSAGKAEACMIAAGVGAFEQEPTQ